MSKLYTYNDGEGKIISSKYPKFLPYNPDEDNGWVVEQVTEDNIEELQEADDDGNVWLDEYVYRNVKTKRLLTTEDAFILSTLDKSWRDPASSGSFSGIYWLGDNDLRDDGWVQSDCAYSESGYSPGYNEAAFGMIEKYLEQSPWKEEEDYDYYFIKGNGGVRGLYLRGWDNEKQEPTDFIRWWMNSDIVSYLEEYTSMACYSDLEGWDENLFENPKQNFTADFNPEDEQHYLDHSETKWKESFEWVFDQSWWKDSVWENDEKANQVMFLLQDADLLMDNGGTNEYFVQFSYSKEQAFTWLSPLVAGMVNMLEPLESIDEDEVLPEYPEGGLREYFLTTWRKFYTLCLTVEEDSHLLEKVGRHLSRQLPRTDSLYLDYRQPNRKAREAEHFAEQFTAEFAIKLTVDLTKIINDMRSKEA